MKQTSEIFSFAVILFVVLKIVNFKSPSFMDITIVVLFVIYAIIAVVQLTLRRKCHGKAKEKDRV